MIYYTKKELTDATTITAVISLIPSQGDLQLNLRAV